MNRWIRSPVSVVVVLVCMLGIFFGAAGTLWGRHPGSIEGVLTLLSGRGFQLDLTVDLEALALGVKDHQHHNDGPAPNLAEHSNEERAAVEQRLKRLLQRRIKLWADGRQLKARVSFPKRSFENAGERLSTSLFGATVRLSGAIAAGSEEVTVSVSRAFGGVQLIVRGTDGKELSRQSLEPGERSQPIPVVSVALPPRDDG